MYEWVSLWPKDGGRSHEECGKPAFIGTTDGGWKTLNGGLKELTTDERPTSEAAKLRDS